MASNLPHTLGWPWTHESHCFTPQSVKCFPSTSRCCLHTYMLSVSMSLLVFLILNLVLVMKSIPTSLANSHPWSIYSTRGQCDAFLYWIIVVTPHWGATVRVHLSLVPYCVTICCDPTLGRHLLGSSLDGFIHSRVGACVLEMLGRVNRDT